MKGGGCDSGKEIAFLIEDGDQTGIFDVEDDHILIAVTIEIAMGHATLSQACSRQGDRTNANGLFGGRYRLNLISGQDRPLSLSEEEDRFLVHQSMTQEATTLDFEKLLRGPLPVFPGDTFASTERVGAIGGCRTDRNEIRRSVPIDVYGEQKACSSGRAVNQFVFDQVGGPFFPFQQTNPVAGQNHQRGCQSFGCDGGFGGQRVGAPCQVFHANTISAFETGLRFAASPKNFQTIGTGTGDDQIDGTVLIEVNRGHRLDGSSDAGFLTTPAVRIDEGVACFHVNEALSAGIPEEVDQLSAIVDPDGQVKIPIRIQIGSMPGASRCPEAKHFHAREPEVSHPVLRRQEIGGRQEERDQEEGEQEQVQCSRPRAEIPGEVLGNSHGFS